MSSNYTIVIFGGSGDLTRRKLSPALFHLHSSNALPANCNIVSFARSDLTDDEYKQVLRDAAAEEADAKPEAWNDYVSQIAYIHGSSMDVADLQLLDEKIRDQSGQGGDDRLYYLALAPGLYEGTIDSLQRAGMLDESNGTRRVVIEKPFGTDLESATKLNDFIHSRVDEHQVFRIDHYLGKDTVQNLLVFRFGNTIFEPLWNRNYIDHVQISVLEEVDVGDRASYYEHSGVLRDMFQSHLLQLMSLVGMEPPATADADNLRDEKAKVLSSVRRLNQSEAAIESVRGQYNGYRETDGVSPASPTATYGAMRLQIDNWRWQGVPFYLRSGKSLKTKSTEVAIQFREAPHRLFELSGESAHLVTDRLRIVIQPNESIKLTIANKMPGSRLAAEPQELEYKFPVDLRDAYERLLLDAINGDASLFTRSDEIELSWAIIDPFVAAWETQLSAQLYSYEPGGWGPEAADQFISTHGRWSNPF